MVSPRPSSGQEQLPSFCSFSACFSVPRRVSALISKPQLSTRRILGLLTLLAPLTTALAQSDWTTVNQPSVWLNTFVDQDIAPRTALWFDGHWRRDGIANPQQLLLRPGVQFTLRPGLRVGGGYAYIATAPYGESPNARPLREHRGWQQISLGSTLGRTAISHRLRTEQRWTGAVDTEGDRGLLTYQQRLRYFIRAQRPLGDRATAAGPVIGFATNEFFLPIGHSDGDQQRLQNRAQLGLGFPTSAKQRIELSYLHQWNRITPRTTHEFNHTLMLSWVWTGRR